MINDYDDEDDKSSHKSELDRQLKEEKKLKKELETTFKDIAVFEDVDRT